MFPHEAELTDETLLTELKSYARYLTGFKDTAEDLFGKTMLKACESLANGDYRNTNELVASFAQ